VLATRNIATTWVSLWELLFKLRTICSTWSPHQDTTRKTLFADLRDGTHTLFTQYIFEHGSEDDQRQLRGMLGADLGAEDRPRVLELFERSGALAHGQAQVEAQLQCAARLVQEGPLCVAARDGFLHLIDVIRARSK
jgi:geranylgeranyl pyrophosphate synthase